MERRIAAMVRCVDCGFLSLRDRDGVLVEAWLPYRERNLIQASAAFGPFCFEVRRDFDAERAAAPHAPNGASSYDTMAEIRRAIECDAWISYRQGASPMEHRLMQDRQWMIEREDRRDSEMRAREDRRDSEARGWHKWELAIFGGVIALATLVGSMIQAGWITRPW